MPSHSHLSEPCFVCQQEQDPFFSLSLAEIFLKLIMIHNSAAGIYSNFYLFMNLGYIKLICCLTVLKPLCNLILLMDIRGLPSLLKAILNIILTFYCVQSCLSWTERRENTSTRMQANFQDALLLPSLNLALIVWYFSGFFFCFFANKQTFILRFD